MIKELISDIAYDKIKLSQALTRSKLIANKLKNKTFQNWLSKELEGYFFEDESLPTYRNIQTSLTLVIEFPYGHIKEYPVHFSKEEDTKFHKLINYHKITEPVSIIEEQIDGFNGVKGYLHLPAEQVQILSQMYSQYYRQAGGVARSAYRTIGKINYQNVLELTKQNLLDILLLLDEEFPNLINDFIMNEKNNERVQHIITNNIYGSNNPTNIAVGEHISQQNTINSLSEEDIKNLQSFGLSKDDIDTLQNIIGSKTENSSDIKGKILNWLGGVSSSLVASGMYEKIPLFIDFMQKWLI